MRNKCQFSLDTRTPPPFIVLQLYDKIQFSIYHLQRCHPHLLFLTHCKNMKLQLSLAFRKEWTRKIETMKREHEIAIYWIVVLPHGETNVCFSSFQYHVQHAAAILNSASVYHRRIFLRFSFSALSLLKCDKNWAKFYLDWKCLALSDTRFKWFQ